MLPALPPSPPLAEPQGTCSNPFPVEAPAASFTLEVCAYENNAASVEPDVVFQIGPFDSVMEFTIESSGTDTVLYVFTSCP